MLLLRKLFVTLFCVLLCFLPLEGQQAPSKDAQAASLMARSLAVMGGQALASSSNLTALVIGSYAQLDQGNPVSSPFTLKARGLDQIRWESSRPDGTVVNIFQKDAAWSITPKGTQQIPISGLVGRQFEVFPLLAIVKWLQAADVDVGQADTETVAGQSVFRIAIRPKRSGKGTAEFQGAFEKMNHAELMLDATTLLPARLRYSLHPGDWRVNIPIELVFSDYQRMDGALVPTKVTRYLRNQKVDEYQIQSVQFNAQLNSSDFTLR